VFRAVLRRTRLGKIYIAKGEMGKRLGERLEVWRKGAGVGHEQCGKKCLAAGEHVVFVNEFSHKVLNVENPDTLKVETPDTLKDLMGRRVAVKGTMDQAAGTIHVDNVNPLPGTGKKKAEAASMDEIVGEVKELKR